MKQGPIWAVVAIASVTAQVPISAQSTTSPSSQAASPKAAQGLRYDVRNGYSLAFVDADIRRVADAVLGSMLGVDYSVDPAVTGNVTLRTAKPVARESLLPLLENALRSVDAAIVVQGDSYRVVARGAARSAGGLAGNGSTAGFATEVITLKNANAREVARLLEQFLGKDVVAGSDVARNQILIVGSEAERESAKALVSRFDVDALKDMNFRTFRLETVEPDVMMKELQAIFRPPFDIIGSRIRLIPLPRLRSIIAIAADISDFDRIEPWIRRLDAGAGGRPKLYNYMVQNGRARDLAAALQRVFGGGGGFGAASGGSTSGRSGFSSSLGSSGSVSTSGTLSAASQPSPDEAIAPQTPLPGGGADDIASGDSGNAGGNGPRIVPSDETNSLLIYANGEQYDLIRQALTQLDVPVPQILIEATLAEVTLNKDLDLGIDWSFLSGKTTFDLRNGANALPAKIFPGLAIGYASGSVQAVLNTLQSRTNVKVLSAPRLMVLNNQTATLQVGDQVPIVSQQAQSVSAAGAPIVNSIELRDTGVILKVTPRVNESGVVTLDIAQEVSDVAETTTSGINSPTIQQRRLATTVTTRSGQMIALGGLIRERTTLQKSGIPFLSQIPVVGAAFGSQTKRGARTELIILITPTVLRTSDDAKAIVADVIQGLDATRPLIERARETQTNAPQKPPK